MNKQTVAKLFKEVQTTLSKNSPALLTGIGIAGMITTTILAVKATPKAMKLIDAKKKELNLKEDEKLTVAETVKTTWKCYVPAAVTGVAASACLIGANNVNTKRNAALAAAYNLSTSALAEYKDKVVETIGEKKEREIRDKIAEDRLEQNPVSNAVIIPTAKGTTRFMDSITKRRFTSDIETINQIVNRLNRRMINGEDYISLNDFYFEIGLEGCDVGDELGWNVTRGLIELPEPPHAVVDSDGVPCIVLEYQVAPKRGYNSFC
jgi:hypothetical protein